MQAAHTDMQNEFSGQNAWKHMEDVVDFVVNAATPQNNTQRKNQTATTTSTAKKQSRDARVRENYRARQQAEEDARYEDFDIEAAERRRERYIREKVAQMPDNGLHELLRWSVRNMPETRQDTFSVSPQFQNTLYPEISPGYSNGSIPQKNYYTKDKSIYGENTDEALDTISNILTATSLVPGIDTFADAAAIPVDLLRGDYISAGLDAFGILPFVGEVADTAKLARAGMKVADAAHDANKLNITHRLTKSRKEMEKLINDIKSNGIKETIKYVEHNGEKFVVDGHHRLHIARLLGLKNIPVEKVNLPYKGYNSINDLFWE